MRVQVLPKIDQSLIEVANSPTAILKKVEDQTMGHKHNKLGLFHSEILGSRDRNQKLSVLLLLAG